MMPFSSQCVLFATLVCPCVTTQAFVRIDAGASLARHMRSEKQDLEVIHIDADASISEHSHAHTDTRICADMQSRQFEFQDDVCGTAKHTIADMLKAFDIEQAYWAGQGVQNPWWAVDTAFQRGKLSEFPTEQKIKFYAAGDEVLKRVLPKVQALGLLKKDSISQGTALDFGCGLGRMSNALAAAGFKKVKCVDQAQTFLDAAKQSLAELAGQGVVVADVAERVDFVKSAPDLLCVQPRSSIDFVFSVITLQHMKPVLQMAYVEQLCDVLRSGGAGSFQMPTFIDNTVKDKHCNLFIEGDEMMMHYTPQDEVTNRLQGRGCKVLSVSEFDMIGPIGKSMLFIFEKQ